MDHNFKVISALFFIGAAENWRRDSGFTWKCNNITGSLHLWLWTPTLSCGHGHHWKISRWAPYPPPGCTAVLPLAIFQWVHFTEQTEVIMWLFNWPTTTSDLFFLAAQWVWNCSGAIATQILSFCIFVSGNVSLSSPFYRGKFAIEKNTGCYRNITESIEISLKV